MSFGNLVSVGPVAVNYKDPQLSWSSSPDGRGVRPATIRGLIQHLQAQALSAYVANPDEQVTIGEHTGVLDDIVFDGDVMGTFTGSYLLTGFELNIEAQWSIHGTTGLTPFSLDAVFLGQYP